MTAERGGLVGGLQHVSVNVDDVESSLAFYVGVLGLRPVARPDIGIGGAWLETANGLQVHLVELPGTGGPDSNHMAFEVADIDATIAGLRRMGMDVPDWTDIGTGRQVFLRDPTGNIVELNQP